MIGRDIRGTRDVASMRLDPTYRRLAEAYELAAVSEPKREYLWILSRTPTVDATRYAALLGRLTAMGLDVNKLEKTVVHKP